MAYAIKNIPLTIHQPAVKGVSAEIAFVKVAAANDHLRIPFRYPFVDISNYDALKTDGYFRHLTTTVSSDLGGSATTNTEGKLGFQLPRTEKLILLVKRTGVTSAGTAKHKFVIEGSTEYGIPDIPVEWAADATFTSGVKLYEIDLFDYGLLISGIDGENGVMIKVTDDESSPALEFALIARM